MRKRKYNEPKGGDDPKKPKPTTQDSLDLYNNTQELLKYYKKYKEVGSFSDNKNAHFENDMARASLNISKPPRTNRYSTIVDGPMPDKTFGISDYRVELDENKYKQREQANAILDLRSPMGLYDKRIDPTEAKVYINDGILDPMRGDMVNINMYNPKLVKPFHMLTEAEKVERRAYMKANGIPSAEAIQDALKTGKPITAGGVTGSRKPKGTKPIYVTDPNDPRYRAYQDSLNSYINDQKADAFIRSLPSNSTRADIDEAEYNWIQKHPINYELGIPDSNTLIKSFVPGNGLRNTDFYDTKFKKPVQPVILQQREGHITTKAPLADVNLQFNRGVPTRDTSTHFPESKYKDGILVQPFQGVPGIDVVSKRLKEDGTLRPVALRNKEGDVIDYNKYKEGKFPVGFQHPEKMQEGGPVGFHGMPAYIAEYLKRQKSNYVTPRLENPTNPLTDGPWQMFMTPERQGVPANLPYTRNSSVTQPISSLPIKPISDTPTLSEKGIRDIPYTIPQPKGVKPNFLNAGLTGMGMMASTMGNIGQPSVGLNTLGGAMQGAGIGSALGPLGMGLGAAIGGLAGFATGGLGLGNYKDMMQERQKSKIKAATVFGTDIGQYAEGGPVEGSDELVPIQAEKGENIVLPDGHIYRSRATKKHSQMERDFITDLLPGDAYVASNTPKKAILRDKADKIVLGYETVKYDENEGGGVPKEITLGDFFNKKKMTPAEVMNTIKTKFPIAKEEDMDPFVRKSNILNLKSRVPIINAVLSTIKK